MNQRIIAPSYLATLALFTLLIGLILAPASPATAQRLPSTVVPEHYALTLTPDLKAATFSGVESIELTIAEPASAIMLNAAEIAFQSVTATANGKQQTASVSLDKDKEQPHSPSLRSFPPARQP